MLDIPEAELAEAMKHSGATSKKEAIVTAINEHNRRRQLERLVARFGKSREFMTQDDLRRSRADDQHR